MFTALADTLGIDAPLEMSNETSIFQRGNIMTDLLTSVPISHLEAEQNERITATSSLLQQRTYQSITTRFHSANATAPMEKRISRLNNLAAAGWFLVTSASSGDGAWTTIVDTLCHQD
jgi:hypothetical protein